MNTTPAFAPRAVVMAVLWVLCGDQALAEPARLQLRSSPLLEETPSERQKSEGAIFVEGARIQGRPDLDLKIQGQASIRRPGLSFQADQLDYDQTQDLVKAQGHVRLSKGLNVFSGPRLTLQVDRFQGRFENPEFELHGTGGHGSAAEVEFVDERRSIIRQAHYTSCRRTPGPQWLPEWLLKATQLTVDEEESTLQAQDVEFRFHDVPLFAVSSLSLPLSNERKSGWLPPLVSVDTVNGVEIAAPYYFNLAPQRDATITTHVMSQRGVAANTEFRYLEKDYKGQLKLDLMPSDRLRNENRWAFFGQHQGSVQTGWDTVDRIGVALSVNRVSDDNYWRDFPRSFTSAGLSLTPRVLPSSASASWSQGNWSMSSQIQRWQTLQDASARVTPPYDRVPQITMRYGQWGQDGWDWSVVGDTTRFEADYSRIPNVTAAELASLRNGERSYVQAQISRPWVRPWGFVTPKVQLHATRYQMAQALDNGERSVTRVLPTFSLDSGLVFERETRWFGRDVLQTLEPRAFYARTPYKDQSFLPVYDSGPADFNLSTIFSDNPYVGHDRLVDNDALTLGLTSRFFDPQTGAELLKVGVAQRTRFTDQQVTLPNQVASSRGLSDILLGASMRWNDRWSFDTTVQANNQTHDFSRTTVQARYNPSPYRVVNAAYRANQQSSPSTEFMDLGWQWPLSDVTGRSDRAAETAWTRTPGQGLGPDRWYSVGRLNYSLKERALVDTIIGLEYDAGCWLGRVAFERLQTNLSGSSNATSRILFQLEFIGFARVGASPLQTLSNNIPRYQYLRDTTTPPSRFQHYE